MWPASQERVISWECSGRTGGQVAVAGQSGSPGSGRLRGHADQQTRSGHRGALLLSVSVPALLRAVKSLFHFSAIKRY